mgnify:FL=1
MSSWTRLNVMPSVGDTRVNLHEPTQANHICAIRVGDAATVQFSTPSLAIEWLSHCIDLIEDADARQANDMAGVA